MSVQLLCHKWSWLRNGFVRYFGRLGIKLTALSMVLLAIVTIGTAAIVIKVMDGFLFHELVKRGIAFIVSTSTPAGYSILEDDHLGLDNMVHKIKASQPDILYVAIADAKGELLAHSRLEALDETFHPASGDILLQQPDVTVRSGNSNGEDCFEFTAPIRFLDKQLGTIQLGIATFTLEQSKAQARLQILTVAAIVLLAGSAGTFFLARIVTEPVARLSDGVKRLASGNYHDPIPSHSQDELGDLTCSFNTMATELLAQRAVLAKYAENLENANRDTIKILSAAIDARDPYTLGHSQRVARLSLLLGSQLNLGDETLRDLELACFLHDVGKIRVPDCILAKKGPLDNDEVTLMVRHVYFGADILGLTTTLERFVPVAFSHHEHYDGSGYPLGLRGEEIPLFASIVAIADAYDAMTSSRPYRDGRSSADALAELQRCRGTQFTPHLVDHFVVAMTMKS